MLLLSVPYAQLCVHGSPIFPCEFKVKIKNYGVFSNNELSYMLLPSTQLYSQFTYFFHPNLK